MSTHTAPSPAPVSEGDLLWKPDPGRIASSNLVLFMDWLKLRRGRRFASYQALWQWSVSDLEGFWGAVWDYFGLTAPVPPTAVLGRRTMPGAEWFPGARLNYAEHVLRQLDAKGTECALVHTGEGRRPDTVAGRELAGQVRRLATRLRAMGVQPGDRVASCMPNIPETVVAMLATTSIGAIWASVSPDFGSRGTIDRLAQLAPRVLFCVDGYRYGGKDFDRRAEMAATAAALPGLQHLVLLPQRVPGCRDIPGHPTLLWPDLLAGPDVAPGAFECAHVPFAHPLWVLFSSGTTGLPKAILHSHGGILIEMHKLVSLHMDLRPGDRMFFYSTSGWMMWNFLVSAMLCGVCPVLYDGNPAWPQVDTLWQVAQDTEACFLGCSPGFIDIMMRNGVVPRERHALPGLRAVMPAGAPVSPSHTAWLYRNVKQNLWVCTGSGGTDVCTGFVGGVPILPVRAGELQAPSLGVAAAAFDAAGQAVVDQVGELVITQPMPSMPVGFWNDPDGSRLRESYFSRFPGVWCQGDLFRINARGGCFVLGRSDATLNRHGIRIGTAEIYRALESVPSVKQGLVVNLDLAQGQGFMPLFVVLDPGVVLDEALAERIRACIRREFTPRHVPDRILQVPDIPMTLTGKVMEVPVRRILLGASVDQAANTSAMRNPDALAWFARYAASQTDYPLP